VATNTPAGPVSTPTIIKIKVHFVLTTPNGLRRVVFGLEKDTQGNLAIWKINFQLFERAKKSDSFPTEPMIELDVEVDKILNSKAEKAAKSGLTQKQTTHALGPASETAKAAEEGTVPEADAKNSVQTTLKK
jgi:hypothetical protein